MDLRSCVRVSCVITSWDIRLRAIDPMKTRTCDRFSLDHRYPQVRIYRAPRIVEHSTPARVQAIAVGAQRWIRLWDTSAGRRHSPCVSSQASTILRLQSDLNDTEQYSRSSNLKLHGLPTSPDENLGAFSSDLSQKLKIPSFSPNQVSAINRLPKRKSGPATVLVRFTSKEVCDGWLAARSKLRDFTNSSNQTPLYFSEKLTSSNRELCFACSG
ncbi:hypothetical protein HPB48_010800 [Haemaphysalis longicornis]|uniref:Uncharacterized protein n=1 Tax=Haemaphysalis longicornis TaxID=44386 RepID=A0A9J6GAM5_HAELO|nr:hypothetical protein HPB48_010800 [Haemaphysalis longicornis]